MIPLPSLPAPAVEQRIVSDLEHSFYLHLEVADRPGVLAQVAEILGLGGASIRSVVQKGLGDQARLVMVMHPVRESRFRAAVELISRLDFVRSRPRVIRVIEEVFEKLSLWRYRDRLPVEPIVTLGEGHLARRGAAPVAAERLRRVAEARGREPDRLVQGSRDDRGGVGRRSRRRRGRDLRLHREYGGERRRLRGARAGLRGAVIVPEGKIATGKLAQALMHGARVIALQGNFDQALELVRRLVESHPIALVNSVNDFRIEGQKTGASMFATSSASRPTRSASRSGTRQRDSWWKGFLEREAALLLYGFQAEGAAPLVLAPASSNRRPWRARFASATRRAGRTRWALTASRGQVRSVSDAENLDAYSLLGAREGSSASRHPRPRSPACSSSTAPRAGVVCVLTGHGLKDPQTAMSRAAAVVPCAPDLEGVRRAVLG